MGRLVMNRHQLKKRLKQEGIPSRAYSFESDGDGEKYRLAQEGERWHVYYAERGEKNTMGWFDTEADACEFFLKKILADPTTRTYPS
jgi:hypothetical protein